MSAFLLWVEDNTSPNIAITLNRNGASTNIAGATLAELSIANDQTGAITNGDHQSATITDEANGVITYTPQSADFPSEGRFKCDVKVTYTPGIYEVFYDQLVVIVRAKNS